MAKIAGVVIAYYPDFNQLLFNIETFINHVEQLFIVFNSPLPTVEIERLLPGNSKIELVINKENIGIAAVLNQTAKKALNLGYDWLLTMDQDSYFQNNNFFEVFERSKINDVAVFSPNSDSTAVVKTGNPDDAEEILCTITSGSLLNLEVWKTIGGFEEKLFIDEVDNDYCLKAVSKGFKIICFKNCHLVHELGKNREVTFLHKKYTIIIHPPIRAYYIFRNNFYMFSKYKKTFPEFVRFRKILLLKVFIKILLYSSERIKNCHYIITGIKDYFNNSYGCYKGESANSKF